MCQHKHSDLRNNAISKLPIITNVLSGVLILLATTILGLVVKLSDRVMANTSRIITIEGNRFTTTDGLELWREIGEIKAQIAASQIPPPWFLEKTSKLEAALQEISNRLDRVE